MYFNRYSTGIPKHDVEFHLIKLFSLGYLLTSFDNKGDFLNVYGELFS